MAPAKRKRSRTKPQAQNVDVSQGQGKGDNQHTEAPHQDGKVPPDSWQEQGMAAFGDKVIVKYPLGKGSFGGVFCVKLGPEFLGTLGTVRALTRQARKAYTEPEFAMKVYEKKLMHERDMYKHVQAERDVLLSLGKHPFLVNFVWAFQTSTHACIVTELIPGGDFFEILLTDPAFRSRCSKTGAEEVEVMPESVVVYYMSELQDVLVYLHSFGVIHRDIKPENLMISATGHLKLIDLGLAKVVEDHTKYPMTFNELIPTEKGTSCGSKGYMAPEVARRQPYNESVDWWSFGAVIYDLLVGAPPLSEPYNYETLIKYPSTLSAEAKDIIQGFLTIDIEKRLGSKRSEIFNPVRRHPFFKGVKWSNIRVLSKRPKPPIVPDLSQPREHSQRFNERTKKIFPLTEAASGYPNLNNFDVIRLRETSSKTSSKRLRKST